jgi:hypothetical protein
MSTDKPSYRCVYRIAIDLDSYDSALLIAKDIAKQIPDHADFGVEMERDEYKDD